MDVLVHVAIQNQKCGSVQRIPAVDSRLLLVLRAAEFGVLLPKIGLNDFGGREKAQNIDVALSYG